MDKFSLKLSELKARLSSIESQIIAEQANFNSAVSKHLPAENLDTIKERINFLKRKQALYKEAEQMRLKNS